MSPINQPDLDLLADYVGGALDGTPEAQQVSERIRTDIAWAAAHAELVAATDDVQTRLRTLDDQPEPMPADVWGRLEAALLAEPPLTESPAVGPTIQAPAGPTRPADNRPAGRAAAGRRRRWAPVLVGIVILAALGLGISALRPLVNSEDSGGAADTTAAAPGSGSLAQVRAVSTGRDYTESTLVLATDFGNANTLSARSQATDQEKSSSAPAPFSSFASPVPTELSRLVPADALSRCLQAVAGVLPGEVVGVDYARYAGSPALIVVIRTPQDERWVGVAGPECGVNGADLQVSKRIG